MPPKKKLPFDTFLAAPALERRVVTYARRAVIFSQGDPSDHVMYLRSGAVQLGIVSPAGKEAIVATFGPGDFFGEGALGGQRSRLTTARATATSAVLVLPKRQMVRLLHTEQTFADRFLAHILLRNARLEADLVDQLFNSSEKRLARALLLLAHYDNQNQPVRVVPKISQETLAEMVGTTRPRVNFFLNKFRKLGLIGYDSRGLTINPSLLNVVVHE